VSASETTALEVRKQKALADAVGAGILTNPQLVYISNTEFVPVGLRGHVDKILACVATGRALGLPDMTALRSIHIIEGKAAFSAELMVMLARGAGHSITGTVTGEKAIVTGTRKDTKDTMTVEWTLEMAERAGLLSKPGWKKYPESYLWARAASQLCRMLFADCFAGATYTPEELGAGDITADELMDEPEPQDPAQGATPPQRSAPDPEEQAGEIVDETDEPVEITEEQRDRLLKLVTALSDAQPDKNWSATLTAKVKKEYGKKSYNDLTYGQLEELLGFLEEQVPARGRAA
jgi:hypothetical protein